MITMRRKSKDYVSTDQTWNYWSKDYGPNNWTKLFSAARGQKQSPIVINSRKCVFDRMLTGDSFRFNYVKDNCQLINDGYSWCITYNADCKSTLFSSNPVGIYKPYEIRCHWGDFSENGSEHVIDDICYAGELQFVHYNMKYNSSKEALEYKDGIMIFSVLLEEAEKSNSHFSEILSLMHKIEFKDRSTCLLNFDATLFLPKLFFDFWTYEGSLTMPPCKECVTWIIFRDPISISTAQLDAFRNLFTVSSDEKPFVHQKMINNVRPVQQLNGRMVRSSFRAGGFSNYSWD